MFYLLIILLQMKLLLNNNTLIRKLRHFNDIGFVPTMGGIHDGHISLIKKSNKFCKKTILSIFVNPKQFNSKKDFKTYPVNIKKDLSILKKIKGLNFVYIPKYKDVYKFKRKSKITIKKKDNILCAKFRKGHFEGVLDVMDRFTKLIKPKKIFMGQKDFQQLFLVKNLIEKKYETKVISCKTIRDKNKIALSSRNYLLGVKELKVAAEISKKMLILKKTIKNKKNIHKYLFDEKKKLQKIYKIKIEYLELRNIKNLLITKNYYRSKIFISYFIKDVRLIDNF